MTTAATIGYGSKLKRGNGATPEVFTAIAEVVSFEPPNQESDEVDVTNLDSPDRFKEYIAGMIEPGNVTMELNFLPSNATQDALTGLIADQAAGTVKNFQILFSDVGATTATFPAFVKGFQPHVDTQGALTATCTLKVAGAITWA